MAQGRHNTQLATSLAIMLTSLLCRDITPIILAYSASIDLNFVVAKWGSEGGGDGQMSSPADLSLYKKELFIADTMNHRVQVFHSSTGRFLRSFVGAQKNTKITPIGLVAGEDELYMVDSKRRDVQVFSLPDFQPQRCFSKSDSSKVADIFSPVSLGLDYKLGQLIVSDEAHNRILFFDKDNGNLVKEFGKEGTGPGEFKNFQKMCVDVDGRELFVVDRDYSRVQVFCLETGLFNRQYSKELFRPHFPNHNRHSLRHKNLSRNN